MSSKQPVWAEFDELVEVKKINVNIFATSDGKRFLRKHVYSIRKENGQEDRTCRKGDHITAVKVPEWVANKFYMDWS